MSGVAERSDAQWMERGAHSQAVARETLAPPLGGRAERWPGVWVADAGSPNPFLNGATLLQPLTEAEAEPLTERLERFFGQREGGPWLLWSSWPTPDLSGLGYVLWGHPPVMVRPAGGGQLPSPSELRIVEVDSEQGLRDVERTLVEGYPLLGLETMSPGCLFPAAVLGDPLRCWVGYVEDRPVSVAAAMVTEDHVHVMMVATRPEARGHGYGAALTWRATLADPSLPAMLEASDDGRPVYERMGYREVGRMSLWERPRDMRRPVYSPYAPSPM
jgi:GNAT superfamily N-acetyltransferase